MVNPPIIIRLKDTHRYLNISAAITDVLWSARADDGRGHTWTHIARLTRCFLRRRHTLLDELAHPLSRGHSARRSARRAASAAHRRAVPTADWVSVARASGPRDRHSHSLSGAVRATFAVSENHRSQKVQSTQVCNLAVHAVAARKFPCSTFSAVFC